MGEFSEKLEAMSGFLKWVIIGVVAVLLIVVVVAVINSGSGELTYSVETSLKDVIASSQLRTSEYTYNSIAEVKDGEKTKYHVAYKGMVKAGLDFDQIEIKKEGTKISVIAPQIQILEVTVDPDLDYIFQKEKYNTEQVYAEATEACKKDLLEKASANQALLETARQGAEDTLRALVKPFESQLNGGETIEIIITQEAAEP